MGLCEGKHVDRGSLPDGGWFQWFKSRASSVLCTGTLKGVQLVNSDGQAVVKACHPHRVEAIRHRYIKPEYFLTQTNVSLNCLLLLCVLSIILNAEFRLNFTESVNPRTFKYTNYACNYILISIGCGWLQSIQLALVSCIGINPGGWDRNP